MWQPQWAATIWKIAGSGVSIKLLSVMQLLSATGFCIGRAVMALLFLLFLPVESHAFLVFEINIVDFYH